MKVATTVSACQNCENVAPNRAISVDKDGKCIFCHRQVSTSTNPPTDEIKKIIKGVSKVHAEEVAKVEKTCPCPDCRKKRAPTETTNNNWENRCPHLTMSAGKYLTPRECFICTQKETMDTAEYWKDRLNKTQERFNSIPTEDIKEMLRIKTNPIVDKMKEIVWEYGMTVDNQGCLDGYDECISKLKDLLSSSVQEAKAEAEKKGYWRACKDKDETIMIFNQEIEAKVEAFEQSLNRYDISSDGIDDNNDMLKGLIKEGRDLLTSLRKERGEE